MKRLIACFVLLVPFASHAQLMKCVGADGRIEYAAQCPPGTRGQDTGIRSTKEGPSSSAQGAPQQNSLAEREAQFKKRQMEADAARQKEEKKMAEAQPRREACEQAQTYLKSLQAGNRISRIDPKTGERVFLEDPDRPAEIARAQRSVDGNCK